MSHIILSGTEPQLALLFHHRRHFAQGMSLCNFLYVVRFAFLRVSFRSNKAKAFLLYFPNSKAQKHLGATGYSLSSSQLLLSFQVSLPGVSPSLRFRSAEASGATGYNLSIPQLILYLQVSLQGVSLSLQFRSVEASGGDRILPVILPVALIPPSFSTGRNSFSLV